MKTPSRSEPGTLEFHREIFALCGGRSLRIIERFSREYLRQMRVGQADFFYPHLAEVHTHSFASLEEILPFLVDNPSADYHLHFSDVRNYHASLYFLENGGLIANVARRYDIPEEEQRSMLAQLVEVVEAQAGYTDIEGLPPDTSHEFLACAAKAPIAYRRAL